MHPISGHVPSSACLGFSFAQERLTTLPSWSPELTWLTTGLSPAHPSLLPNLNQVQKKTGNSGWLLIFLKPKAWVLLT